MKIHTRRHSLGGCLAVAAAVITSWPAISFSQAPPAAGSLTSEAGTTTDYRPKKFSALRYTSIHANSAFEREIIPPEKGPDGPPPTPFDMKIVSVTGKDGRYRVVLIDKKGKYQVVTDTPDADGFHYTDIEPSAKIQDFRVQVSKGGQTEWAEFDTKRYSLASKKIAPPKPANNSRRPAVVPNVRTPPPGRGGTRPAAATTPAAKAAAQKSGAAAQAAIQAANAAAVSASESKSRVNGRRVVLPPAKR